MTAWYGENISLRGKGVILITIPFLFQLVFLLLFLKLQLEGERAQDWAIHTKLVIAEAEGLKNMLSEAHSFVRAYVIAPEAYFKSGFTEAFSKIAPKFKNLRDLVVDNATQLHHIEGVGVDLEQFSQSLVGIVASVDRNELREATMTVQSLEPSRALERIKVGLNNFLRLEEELDAQRQGDVNATSHYVLWTLSIGGVLTTFLALILAHLFGKGITSRFQIVISNVQRLAEAKELSKEISGKDEIGKLDTAFHKMARALSEKTLENEMFIYSVSHDLRSPLVNLQGFSDELSYSVIELRQLLNSSDIPAASKSEANKLLDSGVSESIKFIKSAVGRLSRIIDALLRLSRAGRVEYDWKMVNVKEVVSKVVDAIRSSAEALGAEIRVAELPSVYGDATAVEQIFANLIGNSLKYLDPRRRGVISVGIDWEKSTPDQYVLYVQDNGLGIAKEYQSKLFLVFQRFHEDRAPGEGVGLALVRRIVERHGGKIWAESESGGGSRFFVGLPCIPTDILGQNSIDMPYGS